MVKYDLLLIEGIFMGPAQLNVLVVDDMSYISSLILDHLRVLGCVNPIQKATNVDQAIEEIKKAQ